MVLAEHQMECRCQSVHTLVARLAPAWNHAIVEGQFRAPALRKDAQGLRKGTGGLSPALHKAAQGPQGFSPPITLYRKNKNTMIFLARPRIKLKKPCGPCATNNNAAKQRNDPCATLAQPLRREGDWWQRMPLSAFAGSVASRNL